MVKGRKGKKKEVKVDHPGKVTHTHGSEITQIPGTPHTKRGEERIIKKKNYTGNLVMRK